MCLWGPRVWGWWEPQEWEPFPCWSSGPPRSSLGTRELDHAMGTGASHFMAHRGKPRAGLRWGGLGRSQPLSPLSLLHFNGGGGRRGMSAGVPIYLRGGLLMQGWGGSGWGDGPGPLLLPLSLCCIKLISLALSWQELPELVIDASPSFLQVVFFFFFLK